MARRKAQRRVARWLPWTPAMSELFRLASVASAWTPPLHVRLTPGQSRMTLSARFIDGNRVMTARIRLARACSADEWSVIEEELSIPLGRISGGRK